jgi:hypothetical protein
MVLLSRRCNTLPVAGAYNIRGRFAAKGFEEDHHDDNDDAA